MQPAYYISSSIAAPATTPGVALQRRKPVVRRPTLLLLLLASPGRRRQGQACTRLLLIAASHLLRLQLQLLELLVRLVILLALHLHSSIAHRLLHLYYVTAPACSHWCAILLLLPPLRPHAIIERAAAPATHCRPPTWRHIRYRSTAAAIGSNRHHWPRALLLQGCAVRLRHKAASYRLLLVVTPATARWRSRTPWCSQLRQMMP